jgi:SHS2 domain-containing protein
MYGIVFVEFDVQDATPTRLQATVRGGLAPHLHKHIKAVTYHNLAVVKTEEGLEATVVFDV